MPPVTKLEAVPSMAHDEVVYALHARVKKVWKRTSKKNADGTDEWSFQDVILTDMEGKNETVLTLAGREAWPEAEYGAGKDVWLLAKHGEKNWTGLRIHADPHKKKNVVRCTPTAEISRSDQPADPDPGTMTEPPAETAKAPAAPAKQNGNTAAHHLAQSGRAYCMAVDVAKKVQEWYEQHYNEPMDAAWVQAATATIFIRFDRSGLIETLATKE